MRFCRASVLAAFAYAVSFAPTISALPGPVHDLNGRNAHKPAPLVAQPLNITVIGTNSKKESTIECWSIADFAVSQTPGIAGGLLAPLPAPKSFAFFTLPPQFDGGLHNAPVVQFVYFAGGEAVVSLPTSKQTATINGGPYGLLLATDTVERSAKGHYTRYPSKQETIGVVSVVADGNVPAHTVLHHGQCSERELRADK